MVAVVRQGRSGTKRYSRMGWCEAAAWDASLTIGNSCCHSSVEDSKEMIGHGT